MSSSLITPALVFKYNATGAQRFYDTVAALDVNGVLADISFTVPENYEGKWDFLRDMYLNITLRIGAGNGDQVALVSNVALYNLIEYSDFVAGVSINSTSFEAGKEARISGYFDFGFFSMGARDALEFTVTAGKAIQGVEPNVTLSTVFNKSTLNCLYTYTSSKPTGSDQPYTNVLEVFYCGDDNKNNDNATIREQAGGTKTVNVEDSIAYTNSVGNFEFFTRFGLLWRDVFGLSQNISIRVPKITNDDTPEVLIKRIEFNPSMLQSNADTMAAQKKSLITEIANTDSTKYEYLKMRGMV